MSITLAIVGNINHKLMEFAVDKTVKNLPIDKVKVFSDRKINCDTKYKFIKLKDGFNKDDYSHFCLKELNDYIKTDHVVIAQYDGFATNKQYWTDEFLKYDYIGAPFFIEFPPLYQMLKDCDLLKKIKTTWIVGNGGYSLRSKKLLEALADPKIDSDFYCYSIKSPIRCEDTSIAIVYKKYLEKEHNIKIAPLEVALNFSTETITNYSSCTGFHGFENIANFLTEDECIYYMHNLDQLQNRFFDKRRINMLIYNYLQRDYNRALSYLQGIING
jgi:hypothetical protein